MRISWTTCFLSAALGLATACGSSGGAASGGSTTSALASEATAMLASKLGISKALVDLGLSKAKSMFSGGADKATSAKAGVDAAAAQAEADGKPLVEEQKSGLLDGLKNLL